MAKVSLLVRDKDGKELFKDTFMTQTDMNNYVCGDLFREFPNACFMNVSYTYGIEYYIKMVECRMKKHFEYKKLKNEKKNSINNDK